MGGIVFELTGSYPNQHGKIVSIDYDNYDVKNWTDANNFSENLVIDGNSEWRLPNTDELVTIFNELLVGDGQNSIGGHWTNVDIYYGLNYAVVGYNSYSGIGISDTESSYTYITKEHWFTPISEF